ncbi:hypothetical protein [Micromonospora sp. U21]|uniref:hypothetical protein n=1 Tax=Micromonospora sp. U21 TaxID=2824899 RepID=UPI001B35C078|nr:hypothetical protein [Micromonospora sp. U21]
MRQRLGRILVDQLAGGDQVPRHRLRDRLVQREQLGANVLVEIGREDFVRQRRGQAAPALGRIGARTAVIPAELALATRPLIGPEAALTVATPVAAFTALAATDATALTRRVRAGTVAVATTEAAALAAIAATEATLAGRTTLTTVTTTEATLAGRTTLTTVTTTEATLAGRTTLTTVTTTEATLAGRTALTTITTTEALTVTTAVAAFTTLAATEAALTGCTRT